MNKHTAVLPSGEVVTRNSKNRVYAFAVAVQQPASRKRYVCEQALAYDIRQLANLHADRARLVTGDMLDSTGRTFHIKGENETMQHYRTRPEYIASYDGYIANTEADIVARKAALEADAFQDDEWSVAGWQSRRDLSEKEVARWSKQGWRTAIVEAEVK